MSVYVGESAPGADANAHSTVTVGKPDGALPI
jgi:hypothetical protein